MLSVINGSHALWYTDNHDGFRLTLTNGFEMWENENPITADNKPPGRVNESKEAYLSTLKSAFSCVSEGTSSFEFEFIEISERVLNIIIKEIVQGVSVKTLLFRDSLKKIVNNQVGFIALFTDISAKLRQYDSDVKTFEMINTEYKSQIAQQNNDLFRVISVKDTLQNEMLKKMCLVLNTNKREYQRMKEKVTELQAEKDEYLITGHYEIPVAPTAIAAKGKKAPVARKRKSPTDANNLKEAVKKSTSANKRKKKNEISSEDGESENEMELDDSDGEEIYIPSDAEEEERSSAGGKSSAGKSSAVASASAAKATLQDTDEENSEDDILCAIDNSKKAKPSAGKSNNKVTSNSRMTSSNSSSGSVLPAKSFTQELEASQLINSLHKKSSSGGNSSNSGAMLPPTARVVDKFNIGNSYNNNSNNSSSSSSGSAYNNAGSSSSNYITNSSNSSNSSGKSTISAAPAKPSAASAAAALVVPPSSAVVPTSNSGSSVNANTHSNCSGISGSSNSSGSGNSKSSATTTSAAATTAASGKGKGKVTTSRFFDEDSDDDNASSYL